MKERKKELDKAQKKKEERDPLSLSFCLSLSLFITLSRARLSLFFVWCVVLNFGTGAIFFPKFRVSLSIFR